MLLPYPCPQVWCAHVDLFGKQEQVAFVEILKAIR